jgi:predicted phage tail protein
MLRRAEAQGPVCEQFQKIRSKMTNISIEGHLAEVVGSSWTLKVRNFMELFNAIEANTNKLRDYFNTRTKQYWAIFVDGERVDAERFMFQNIENKEVKIIPLLAGGASAMAAAIVSAIGAQGTAAIILEFVISAIISMAISFGLSMLMAKLMKTDDPEAVNTTSYIFSSPENVSQQGQVVPVGYGRVKVGSTVISVSSSNVDRQIWEDNDMDVLGGLKSVFTRSPDVKSGGGGGGGSIRTNYQQK